MLRFHRDQYPTVSLDGATHMRLSRWSDADPLSIEYFLVKDDNGCMPASGERRTTSGGYGLTIYRLSDGQ